MAAIRRLNFELNIQVQNTNEFQVMDKILYKNKSDEIWGEYEGKNKFFFFNADFNNIIIYFF